MLFLPRYPIPFPRTSISATLRLRRTLTLVTFFLVVPAVSFAQAGGTPFDTGFTAIQTLFTGTIAKVASLVAIVIGGYAFAHGEPGAKISARFAYVAVSRASFDARIYTNHAATLGAQLSHEVSKTAAMEVSQSAGHAPAEFGQGIRL